MKLPRSSACGLPTPLRSAPWSRQGHQKPCPCRESGGSLSRAALGGKPTMNGWLRLAIFLSAFWVGSVLLLTAHEYRSVSRGGGPRADFVHLRDSKTGEDFGSLSLRLRNLESLPNRKVEPLKVIRLMLRMQSFSSRQSQFHSSTTGSFCIGLSFQYSYSGRFSSEFGG